MSLEKAIKSGKEHRKPYRGSKAFDPSCANGDCPACKSNALHSQRKRVIAAETQEIQQAENDSD